MYLNQFHCISHCAHNYLVMQRDTLWPHKLPTSKTKPFLQKFHSTSLWRPKDSCTFFKLFLLYLFGDKDEIFGLQEICTCARCLGFDFWWWLIFRVGQIPWILCVNPAVGMVVWSLNGLTSSEIALCPSQKLKGNVKILNSHSHSNILFI